MLDPKEMKKGGFGSFAELDRERREQRAAADAAAHEKAATITGEAMTAEDSMEEVASPVVEETAENPRSEPPA